MYVSIDIDPTEILSEISTHLLVEELIDRDVSTDRLTDRDWENLYNMLASRRIDDALSQMKSMVEIRTGRIIP